VTVVDGSDTRRGADLGHIPHSVPQIVINRDPIPHCDFDICFLGECDDIVAWLAGRLGWHLPGVSQDHHQEDDEQPKPPPALSAPVVDPVRVGDSHVWLWPGANANHRWVRQFVDDDEEEEKEEEQGETKGEAPGEKEGKGEEGSWLKVPEGTPGRGTSPLSGSRETSLPGSDTSAGSLKRPRND
jgi:hypothetical protein